MRKKGEEIEIERVAPTVARTFYLPCIAIARSYVQAEYTVAYMHAVAKTLMASDLTFSTHFPFDLLCSGQRNVKSVSRAVYAYCSYSREHE